MSFRSSPLDNPINWSFGVGRLWGINIRVHVVLVVVGAVMVFQSAFAAQSGEVARAILNGVGQSLILFIVVLVHEFGHCYGARRTGGEADEVLLWPLGGLAMVSPPHHPRAHLITTIGGPIVHPAIGAAAAAIIVWEAKDGQAIPWNPLHPFTPVSGAYYVSELHRWMSYVFGINYVMLLFNLVPMYPLDGGRILQALLWPRMGFVQSTQLATFVGMVGAVGLAVFGIVTKEWTTLGIAVFGYFECWRMRQAIQAGAYSDEPTFGYDFSKGFGAFKDTDHGRGGQMGFFARRRARRALERERREAAAIEERQRRIDAILQKVHRDGMHSLTAAERRFLAEETERQRSNQLR